MNQAQKLANALNVLAKAPQFSYLKARASARADGNVDWPATKSLNADFNPEVDGSETFVMRDGSRAEWQAARLSYAARLGS